jgi:hypothetical protein
VTKPARTRRLEFTTMLANLTRKSHAATCEEWDEDAQTTLPDTRTSANVAAKRSKPELVSTKSRSHSDERVTDKMARKSTSKGEAASPEKDKKLTGLKVDTFFPKRESRLYSSGPPAERSQPSTIRPSAKRSTSKVEKHEPFMRHPAGQCLACDYSGYHMNAPAEPRGSKESSTPQPPLTASQQPSQSASAAPRRPEASTIQPRERRSSSYRDQRPMSFHSGVSYDAYDPLSSHPGSAVEWNMPLVSPFTYTPYAQAPTTPSYTPFQEYSHPLPTYSQVAPQPSLGPQELHRGTSSRREPIIQQSPMLRNELPLTQTISQRDFQRSQKPSLSREEDARRMPPPEIIPGTRRPNLMKAKTSASTPASHHRERSYGKNGGVSEQPAYKERRSDPPPTSFPPSAYQNLPKDRPAPRKSTSYHEAGYTTKVSSSVPRTDRRPSMSSSERHEMEAEAYQRAHGTKSQPLTVDAVSKISRKSDSGSQRSSRGSSTSKTKTTVASNDITLTIGGRVTLDISGDSAENHSIKIQPKRSGGVNISFDERKQADKESKVVGLLKRSGSTTSSSRQSRRSSEKEVRRSRDESFDQELERTNTRSSQFSKASFEDSHGYGVGYG